MLTGLVRFLRGEVRIRVVCRAPERLLNLCAARGIPFREVRWESSEALLLSLYRRDWDTLRRAAGGMDCAFTVAGQSGLPWLAYRLCHRPALAITLTIAAFALFLGSFFIWDFTVEGNETVPEEAILRALERQGVGIGTFGLSLNGQDLRNHVLLDVPELAWMTVNVSGCRAKVQVVERVEPPEILNEAQPSNVVARRSGMVREIRALNGAARVMRGMSVDAGDLLISGTEELDTLQGGVRTMAAHGSVTARTWHTYTAAVPLTGMEKRDTGRSVTGFSLVLGRHRVRLYPGRLLEKEKNGESGQDGETGQNRQGGGQDWQGRQGGQSGEPGGAVRYDKSVERTRLALLDVVLPVTVVRETYRFYQMVPVERTAAEAKERAEAALRDYLEDAVSPYGEVKSALCTFRRRGDVLDVTLTAECEEEIGVVVPIGGGETAE